MYDGVYERMNDKHNDHPMWKRFDGLPPNLNGFSGVPEASIIFGNCNHWEITSRHEGDLRYTAKFVTVGVFDGAAVKPPSEGWRKNEYGSKGLSWPPRSL